MKIQKALHLHEELDKARPKHHGHDYYMFEKYDGWYGYVDICRGSTFEICSRAGRVIPSLTEFSKGLTKAVPRAAGRLIFEIMIPDMEFAELNGVLNRKYNQAENAYIMVHDFIPTDCIDMPFVERYKLASEIVHKAEHKDIRLAVPLGVSHMEPVWRDAVQRIWAEGGEGLILKRAEAKYGAAVRNYDLMKIKEELTLDLLVIGLDPGKGKYEGTTGALILRDSKGCMHKVSGMTDSQRIDWWKNREEIVGLVVEVKAMKKLPDGQLREPRFKAIRHDKTKDDID